MLQVDTKLAAFFLLTFTFYFTTFCTLKNYQRLVMQLPCEGNHVTERG